MQWATAASAETIGQPDHQLGRLNTCVAGARQSLVKFAGVLKLATLVHEHEHNAAAGGAFKRTHAQHIVAVEAVEYIRAVQLVNGVLVVGQLHAGLNWRRHEREHPAGHTHHQAESQKPRQLVQQMREQGRQVF